MSAMRKRFSILLGAAAAVLGLDLFTKYLVVAGLDPWQRVEMIPGFFNLVRVHNRGAAFGFMNSMENGGQLWLFGGAAVLAAAIIFFIARTEKSEKPLFFASLGLILGGAAGNLVDRIRYGHVVDFLDFYLGSWHWPAFNVADIAICCGVFGVLLHMWRNK